MGRFAIKEWPIWARSAVFGAGIIVVMAVWAVIFGRSWALTILDGFLGAGAMFVLLSLRAPGRRR
jgi:hypothetical protein